MKQQTAAIAGGGQEAGELAGTAQHERTQGLRDRAYAQGLDLQGDLAGLPVLGGHRLVLESKVEGWESGRRVAQRAAFDQSGRQNQPVQTRSRVLGRSSAVVDQALASWAALRASSFSTDFIMIDGAVSALLLATVRWRSTASL